jgi:hypothetical protein
MEAELTANSSPQFPLPIVLMIVTISGAVLLLSLRRAASLQGMFVLVAIWLRVVCGAFSNITFSPIVGPLSINALLSVGLTCIGVLVVSVRTFSQKWVLPFYAFIFLMCISAAINNNVSGFIDMFFKWMFAIVMIAAIRDAMLRVDFDRIISLVAICYMPIFVLQFLAFAVGMGKSAESDGSVSYVGGYNHEAVFSVMVATFMLAVYLKTNISFTVRAVLVGFGVFSIVLCNYRTAIIAILPLLFGVFMVEGLAQFDRKSRTFVSILMIPLTIFVVTLGLDNFAERFSDIGVFLSDPDRFWKPSNQFSHDDQKVLSGRPFMWMEYINGYLNGTDLQMLIGYGPNGWVGVFKKYAHNTLVSLLFELGMIGILLILTIWTMFIIASLSLRDPVMRLKFGLAQASFILLNFATMPHWQIEGMIMFSLLQGTLLYQIDRSREISAKPANFSQENERMIMNR